MDLSFLALPEVVVAEHNEVIDLIENQRLMGKGLGFIDMHLIASALMNRVNLWTLDRKMNQFAALLGLAHLLHNQPVLTKTRDYKRHSRSLSLMGFPRNHDIDQRSYAGT